VSFQQHWPNATADGTNSNNLQPPDEGLFDVALIDAGAFTSKRGADIAKVEFRVVSQAYNGAEWAVLLGFDTQTKANIAKATCAQIGVDVETVESLDELDTALKEKVGGYYTVEVKRNGEYLNTYIQGEADVAPPEPAAVAAGQPITDDDIPF
jgi:hypothetical protein